MTAEPVLRTMTEDEIPPELDARLIHLLSTCFQGPNDAPFRVQSYWRKPPARRWILFQGDEPVAQATVHRETVKCAAGELQVGDIADVCVHPDWRGHGFVRQMLREAHAWMKDAGMSFAFLTGRTEVYSSSGYVPVSNPIRYFDPIADAWKEETVANAMVRPLAGQPWPEGLIDWGGPMY